MDILQIIRDIKKFFDKLSEDYVYAFSAQSAFFMIFSFIPFLILLVSAIKYLPVTQSDITTITSYVLPGTLSGTITSFINQVYVGSNISVFVITGVSLFWAASKGVYAIMRGINTIYGIEYEQNYFHVRFLSVIYTIIFGLILLIVICVLGFGLNILAFIQEKLFIFNSISLNWGYLASFALLTIVFLIIYCVVPKRKFKILKELPGAIFSSTGWLLFSIFYSLYTPHAVTTSYIYGSLTMAILFMLWLYICMYIVFVGAELNVFLQNKGLSKTWKSWRNKNHKKATFKEIIKTIFE